MSRGSARVEDLHLPWEALGRVPRRGAFWCTAKMLLLRPRRFFERMADSGGLHEPLTFFWAALSAFLVLAFPLALLQFALAGLRPEAVSAEAYAQAMLPVRISGFLLVLLPITLTLSAVGACLLAGLYHLGASVAGIAGLERTLSTWFYMLAAGLLLLAAAAGFSLVVALVSYLLVLKSPGAAASAGFVTTLTVRLSLLLALVLAAAHAMIALFNAHRVRSTGGRAAVALLAGLVALGLAATVIWWLGVVVPAKAAVRGDVTPAAGDLGRGGGVAGW